MTGENTFNSPDGLGFDPAGRLWIQTDGKYSNKGNYDGQGNNQMLVADPATKEIAAISDRPQRM
ncbi:alkaline phosphatase PhoX [Castellaniella defragrans]|uniref:alkaline phosphatase PhoX n=1 Tax=Castellaniella defragrans TaxID=75697 RepID=UPI002AFF8F9A|nr:alkaline phosphatase PhoX [Castellaniella defragrans]